MTGWTLLPPRAVTRGSAGFDRWRRYVCACEPRHLRATTPVVGYVEADGPAWRFYRFDQPAKGEAPGEPVGGAPFPSAAAAIADGLEGEA
jgi:hypothetical protein